MKSLLLLSESNASSTDTQVVQAFLSQTEKIYLGLYEVLPVLGPVHNNLDDHTYSSFLRYLCSSLRAIDYMHQNLSLIRSHWTPPEAHVFVEAVFSPIVPLGAVRTSLSVVLSDSYMFEETNLSSYLLQGAVANVSENTPTLFLPKLEASNPLQWGTLVHEMGHAFSAPVRSFLQQDEVRQDILAIIGGKPQNAEVVSKWAEEIFCDLLATHLLGPAYLASFVDFIVVLAASNEILSPSRTHPFPQWRVEIIGDALKEASVGLHVGFETDIQKHWTDLASFFFALFEERADVESRHLGGKGKRASIDVREFNARIRHHLPGLVQHARVTAIDQEKLPLLRERLRKKIPIATVGSFEDKKNKASAFQRLRNLHLALGAGDSARAEVELSQLQKGVREHPCSVAEIMVAGWLYKVEDLFFPAVITLEKFSPEAGEQLAGELLQLDGLLRNSIESAYLAMILSPDPKKGSDA